MCVVLQVEAKPTDTRPQECSCNLLTVDHKVSEIHLYHAWR